MRYRFFQRDGGVSQGRFAGLNLSYHVGDDHFHVDENRRRVKEAMGAARLVSARQVHGDRIFLVEGGETGDFEVDGYDALITTEPGTALLVQQADCQAVLLHDPACRAVAAIHCGWRGSVAGLIGKTVALMSTALQTDPRQCEAFIGPSLGPCCAEFVNYRTELPSSFRRFQHAPNYFDFWQLSAWQLTEAGVPIDRIRISRICTSCSTDYFSYRRACRTGVGVTGRHGSAICLQERGAKSLYENQLPRLAGSAGGCIAKARRDGESGPEGCGQDVRSRRPGHGWPVCRPRSPADQAAAKQPEAGPVSPSDRDAAFHCSL